MTMIKVREPAGSDSQGNVVQFASQIFYCTEEELEAHVVVQRLGIVEAVRSEVPFTTRDSTGIAGERYEATSGVLVFQPGEVSQTITVKIVARDTWAVTTGSK